MTHRRRVLFDLEGNGLLPTITKVHCIAAADIDTRERFVWGPHHIPDALAYLATADELYAHNGLTYDFPVLEKLHGFVVPFERQRDTLVMARVLFPNRKEEDSGINAREIACGRPGMGEHFGRHTLRAWGIRLGTHKGDFEGPWDEWSQEMQDYCVQDIDTTLALWDYLQGFIRLHGELVKDWTPAFTLERRVQLVCAKISEAGWPFDMQKAGKLHAHLSGEKERLARELVAEFDSKWVKEEVLIPKKNNKKRGYVAGAPFVKRIPIPFNPDSRQHMARALLERGWKPTEFTDGGSPKLDEETIENIALGFPAAGNLATFLMIGKRLGQLANGKQALLNHVGDDLRIHGQINPMGAVTSRASHFNPNVAQVPKVGSPYGQEFRELFYAPEGWEQVGADMEGLEGRCLAHDLWPIDKGEFEKRLLEGDIHWGNVQAMGLVMDGEERDDHNMLHKIVRDGSKTFYYGWLYGAGDEKAGRILLGICRLAYQTKAEWKHLLERFFGSAFEVPGKNKVRNAGKALKARFLRKMPALGKLIRRIKGLVDKHGALPGLDKRRIPVRSDHAALNTRLQSSGAILCKQWLCDFYDATLAAGYRYGWDGDFVILGWIHDEIQVACRNGLGDEFGRLLTTTAKEAGRPFGFRVRLDSNYKIGRSWAACH